MFTDPALFDLEMRHIFEGNWVFLVHESQIPEPNDYFTTWIGCKPIVIRRDKSGELHGLINACAQRGAMLCRRKHGNKGSFTCPFHGWTFNNGSKLLKVKDGKTGDYPASFNSEGSHDLTRLAKFENYRGFLFGSLNADVPSLEKHLSGARAVIDQIVDAAPEGLEVLRGNSAYTFDGNWKLQMENGADGYHVSSVHWNYSATMGRRNYEAEGTRTVDANGWAGADDLWNDLSRGAVHWIDGPDENALAIGLKPILSGDRSEDEGLFVRQHEYWAQALIDALHQNEARELGEVA